MSYILKPLVPSAVTVDLGLEIGGPTQMYYMDRVAANMMPRLPYRRDGSVEAALMQGKEYYNQQFRLKGPHQRYLYEGHSMAGKPKRATERLLNYTTTKNAQAGPKYADWVQENRAAVIAQEVQAFIQKRKGTE